MSFVPQRAVILGATGPTGIHLARELAARGTSVRVVSRSSQNLELAFHAMPVERVTADLLDAPETKRATEGCDLVFQCLGLPMERIDAHPVAARNLAAAIGGTGARCVHVSSYWSYIPISSLPLSEDHPRLGGSHAVQMRREAEDILHQAGAAVVQLPDFYGPQVQVSSVQKALEEAAQGKPVNWIGSPAIGREYAFVPDAMKAVAELSTRTEAYGERWIVPGSGPISFHEIAGIIEHHLGRPVRIRAAGQVALRVVSLFMRDVRQLLPLVPTYVKPIHYDGSKLHNLLGEVPVTPYAEAIPATLDWLTRRTVSS